MSVTIRGSSKLYVNNASSGAIPLPSGSAAGDLFFAFCGHGYAASTPTGASALDNQVGSFYNGAVFLKKLTSGDITTGSITVGFGGSYYGTIMAVTLVGSSYYPRVFGSGSASQRNSTGSTSRTVTTATGPQSGDLAIYFGAFRGSTGASTGTGTVLQTDTNSTSCGVLAYETVGSTGTLSETFTYGSGSAGDYQAILVISGTPVVPGTTSDQWRINVTATQGAGQNPGIAEIELRATSGGADQAVGGSANQSSYYSGGYVGANAFDNSSVSYWLAGSTAPQWVSWTNYYTLDVYEVSITQGGSTAQSPTAFDLQYYNYNLASWVTLKSFTTPATWTAGETRVFTVSDAGAGSASGSGSASASGIGLINKLFDFTGGSLPSGATLTRASSGMYFNSSGTLVSATTDTARFDYNPATLTLRGLLIEPAATNLILQSQTIDVSPWGSGGGAGNPSVTANAVTAPDGNTTAERLTPGTTNGNQHRTQNVTYASAGTYTLSAFFEPNSYTKAAVGSKADGTFPIAYFDLTTGTLSAKGASISSTTITQLANGWWRASATFAVPSGQLTSAQHSVAFTNGGNSITFAGDGTSNGYVWQVQLEAGSVATSPIVTTSASASRSADALTLNWGTRGEADGTITVRYTFDDSTTQDVSTTVSSGTSAVPTNLNRPWIKTAGIIYSAAGSSSGAGVASGVGRGILAAVGSAAGSNTSSGAAKSTAASAGSASGAATATAQGIRTAASAGSASGVGTVAGVGIGYGTCVGSSAGVSTVTGVGSASGAGVGASAGTSTCIGVGLGGAVGSVTATGSAAGVGTAVRPAVGATAGSSTAAGGGFSSIFRNGDGSAQGTSAATGIGSSVGSATGATSATGVASATGATISNTVGSAAGIASAAASATAIRSGVGSISGLAVAVAFSTGVRSGAGAAAGIAKIRGRGQAKHNIGPTDPTSWGDAGGIDTALATGASTAAAAGVATGAGSADAGGFVSPVAATAGQASGQGSAQSDGAAVVVGSGSANAVAVATADAVADAQGVGTATGAADVLAVSAPTAETSGAVQVTGIAQGAGRAVWLAVGSSLGVGGSVGVCASIGAADAAAEGATSAVAVGTQLIGVVGAASGHGTGAGASLGIVSGAGQASGNGQAQSEADPLGPRTGRVLVVRRTSEVEPSGPRIQPAPIVVTQGVTIDRGDRIVEAPRAA